MGTVFWENSRNKTVVERRPGGPGNPWQILSVDGGLIGGAFDAPSGGRQPVESSWGRAANGDLYLGTQITGNKERYTFNVMAHIVPSNFPDGLLGDLDGACKSPCLTSFNDIRVRQRCEDVTNRVSYQYIQNYLDAHPTSTSMDNPLADDTEGVDQKVKWQEAMSAGIAQGYIALGVHGISKSHTDTEINHGIYVCDKEWWNVSDADATPGYAGTNAPLFGWTLDNGATWTFQYIGSLLGADALQVAKSGANVIVVSASGIAYAPYEQVKRNLDNAWAAATPIGTAAYSVAVAPSGAVWVGGASGAIWKSTDTGFSYVSQITISGAPNFQAVSTHDDSLVWFAGGNGAGTNGTVVRFMNGEYKTIGGHGVTGATVKVVVPPGRPDEVYVFGSDGEIAYSENARESNPTWTDLAFPAASNGQVIDVQFAGFNGDVMFIVQSNIAVDRFRILRDFSGGAGGADVELVNDFQSSPGGMMRSFAPATPNLGLGFGSASGGFALIAKVSKQI